MIGYNFNRLIHRYEFYFSPYYKDLELEDYLKLHLKNKGQTDKNFKTHRPPLTAGEVLLAALKAKTKKVLKPVVDKIKHEIPKRIIRGYKRAFGTRRQFSDADLDDTYYYDEDEPKEDDVDVYEYYEEDQDTKGFNEPYYVTDNVIVFPKPESKSSKMDRIAQKTADLNYDYNYDYVDGNYPRRIPPKKKKPDKDRFDTSRFF